MVKKSEFKEVPVDKLRWRCDPSMFEFQVTSEILPCDDIIGQERAIKAISLGLDIDSIGYNIFVTGLVGTGKDTTIKCLLEKMEKKNFVPNDLVYVNNFKDQDLPRILSLPASHGNLLKKDMQQLVDSLKTNIPQIFESEEYQESMKSKLEVYREKESSIIKEFENKVSKDNFTLIQVKMGPYTKPDIFPVVNGEPQNFPQIENLVKEGKFDHIRFFFGEIKNFIGVIHKFNIFQ